MVRWLWVIAEGITANPGVWVMARANGHTRPGRGWLAVCHPDVRWRGEVNGRSPLCERLATKSHECRHEHTMSVSVQVL